MGTSASFALARKITACIIAALLSLALVPASALAEDGRSGAEGSEGAFGSEVPTSPQPPSDPSTEASSSDVTLSGAAEGGEVEGSNEKPLTLASGLVGAPSNFINSDVALDGEPVIGSFTVDGLTYAVTDESTVELVGVAPSVILSGGSEAAGVEESNSNQASEAGVANLALPETITYEGATHTLASIAPYAFYLSGVTDVTLPASISDVDDRAFRSSDVANVAVADSSPTYTSFDGALYSADKTRLLLIPEGRVGAVLLPREAEVADPGKFSHCSLVDAISVEDGAAFASENGLLYSSDLTTLLRVPAGATDITIREGCTTIAAGALEACAKLTTINAPATIASISPDIFHAIPTVSLPAASVILSEGTEDPEVEESNESHASEAGAQLTAMVALSSADDDLPEAESSDIVVALPEGAIEDPWKSLGFTTSVATGASLEKAALLKADSLRDYPVYSPSGSVYYYYQNGGGSTGFWPNGISLFTVYHVALQSGKVYASFDASGATLHDRWYGVSTSGGVQSAVVRDSKDGRVLLTVNGTRQACPVGDICLNGFRPTWTVTWDANGGSCDVQTSTPFKGESAVAPEPKRDGYVFRGWYDSLEGGNRVCGAGEDTPAITAECTLYAQWTLAYDLTLPICDPAEVTFKVDATTGEVSAVGDTANEDGIHHDGTIASSMAVPVALSSVSLEALKKDDGTYGLASIFPGDDPLGKAKLTMKAKDAEASVAFGKTETAVSDFVVPSVDEGGKLSVSYGLELVEGVGPADIASDTGEKAVPVGKLTYTADVIGGIASVHDFFTLDDGQSGRVLGAELIKGDAEHIAALHGTDALASDSTYLKYKGWLEQDHRFYAKWEDGNLYEVRIIGINHDDKADGTGKAGLTFQFVERLAPHDTDKHGINQGYRMMGSTSVVGKYGWGRSELRARMNPNDDPLVSAFTVEVGTDDNAIWNLVPSKKDGRQCLGDVMVPVKKRYYAAAAGGTITANDKMFLASVAEHIGTTFSDGKVYGTLNSEGSQYEFWAQPESASEMHKTYGKWTRSHYPNLTYYASTGVINSVQFSHPDANVSFAVVPCFCL